MLGIEKTVEKLNGTSEAEILTAMVSAYTNVTEQQKIWYEKSEFVCPDGCGECCRNFEPDLLECEALFMAAWLMENQPEIAEGVSQGVFPFPREKACQFWKEDAEYHCSIYGGRPSICRLFGACGNHGKNGETVFKPCRFYPAEKLAEYKVPLAHKQYSQTETLEIFGILPPVMSDLMEGTVSINPDSTETRLIRDILPETIKKLRWIIGMNSQK